MDRTSDYSIVNSRLLVPYFAPYMAYVSIAFLGKNLPYEWNYLLRATIVLTLLLWGRKRYITFRGPKSPTFSALYGLIYGVLGTLVWIGLMAPFVGESGETWYGAAFTARLLTATLIVPVFEELSMRGYIFRLALQWDKNRLEGVPDALSYTMHSCSINDVRPGEWTFFAAMVSILFFTVGHAFHEWPAAIAYGALMTHLLIFRKDLLSCIVAHGTTNMLLGLYVQNTGQWIYW